MTETRNAILFFLAMLLLSSPGSAASPIPARPLDDPPPELMGDHRVTRWGERTDVNGWIPFEFTFPSSTQPIREVEFVLTVKPIGNRLETDTLTCLDLNSEPVNLYRDLSSLPKNRPSLLRVKVDDSDFPTIFDQINRGRLQCVFQDDTSLYSAQAAVTARGSGRGTAGPTTSPVPAGNGEYCGNVLSGGSPPGALQTFFNGALNLGFHIGRASQCPPMARPPSPTISRSQLAIARRGVEAIEDCVDFDPDVFDRMAAKADYASDQEQFQDAFGAARDLGTAIDGAGFTCDQGHPTLSMIGLYQSAILIGTAAGRASCQPCQSPLPPAVGQTIRNELNGAANSLEAVEEALQPPADGLSRYTPQQLGAVPTGPQARGLDTYIGIIAAYTELKVQIANSTICCSCPAPRDAGPTTPTHGDDPCGTECVEWCLERGYASGELADRGLCMLDVIHGYLGDACRCRR